MKTRQAHASIVLFNYVDRGGSQDMKSAATITSPILLDKEIVSIGTTKQKSSPTGQFEFSLAPTKNWVTHITPGSWVMIHMAPRVITKDDIMNSSKETLKMVGRIDTVRVHVGVGQDGTRQTLYRVRGRDWGLFFESSMYIDPAASFSNDSAISQANKLSFDHLVSININKKENNASTSSLMQFIIDLFAGIGLQTQRETLKSSFSKGTDQFLPQYEYRLPNELASMMNSAPDAKMTSSIKLITGKLNGYDKYLDESETVGMPLYNMFLGNNMLWQLLNEHSCSVVNELVAELRWDQKKPSFCLYKRVKPFLLLSTEDPSLSSATSISISDASKIQDLTSNMGSGKKIQSSFFNLKRSNVDLEDIIELEMGTNWQDSANFIEVMPDPSFIVMPTGQNAVANTLPGLKAQSNKSDLKAWARDGFRPLMFNTKFFPTSTDGLIDINGQIKWLPTLARWYFDTHKMLNGTVTIIGQDKYIGVGDNIMFPSVAAGYTHFVKFKSKEMDAINKKSNVLAHVESISHTFTVQSNGARNFQTTVNFSRGVMANPSGTNLVETDSFAIDNLSNKIPEAGKKHFNTYES